MPSSSYVHPRARIPVGLTVALGLALVMACDDDSNSSGVDDNQFRSDVLDCESAVAHLQSCCGSSFDPTKVTCHYIATESQGCGDGNVHQDPDISETESDCVRGQSCADIAKGNVCARVLQRSVAADRAVLVDAGTTAPTPAVCP